MNLIFFLKISKFFENNIIISVIEAAKVSK
jgi:hypothetical protein